jgi:hypothetical protein
MNASQLFADIETGCLVEVESAKCHFYSEVRGLTVRQSFYVYPDDTIVCLNACDGSYEVLTLTGDDEATFRFHNSMYFQ